jgi:ABC-type antimicrobial peptide transport system permease subunit
MALGATRRHIVTRITAPGAVTASAGIAAGLVAASVATRWLTDLLYETSPRDPFVFLAVAVTLAIAGLAAAILPARRSTRVDPLIVLRTE